MTRCANGHDSSTEDYCDTCGIRIGGDPAAGAGAASGAGAAGGGAAAAGAAAAVGGASATTPSGTVTPDVAAGDCPNCGAPRDPGERFCEVCGLDFDTGAMPAPPTPVSAAAPPSADPAAGSPVPPPPGIGWVAVLSADRGWWQDNSGAGGVADGVPFPDPAPPERRITLQQAASVVGRTSGSSVADVDCGSADTGVSRKHCRVTLQPDGSWTVTDLGSTNGTFVGDASVKLTPQAETPYDPAAGPIKIGAYTVVHLEPDPSSAAAPPPPSP